MKLLVTGGSGMVGRNLLPLLEKFGFNVVAPSSAELDLLNPGAVELYVQRESPEFIVHLAGVVGGIQANIENPAGFFRSNLLMGVHLVDAAKKYGVKNLVNVGSSCMYPRDSEGLLNEDMLLTGPLEPTNEGYALAKIAVSRYCRYSVEMDPSLQFKTVVPCNLFGPYDNFHPTRSHLLPAVISKIHKAKEVGENYVDLWGTGAARREFMYVGDFCQFLLEALQRFSELPEYMNVGLGRDYSVREYYDVVAEVIGWSGEYSYLKDKPEGMMRKVVEVSRQQAFGWEPITTLKQGVALTYQYYLKEYLSRD